VKKNLFRVSLKKKKFWFCFSPFLKKIHSQNTERERERSLCARRSLIQKKSTYFLNMERNDINNVAAPRQTPLGGVQVRIIVYFYIFFFYINA